MSGNLQSVALPYVRILHRGAHVCGIAALFPRTALALVTISDAAQVLN